jgi:STE24 endopeptidase
MPFVLLLTLALTCLEGAWPPPPGWLGPVGSVALTWGGVAVLVGVAALASRQTARQARHSPPPARLGSWRRKHLFLTLALFVAALFVGGWGATARQTMSWDGRTLPGAQLFLLSPLFSALLLTWACTYAVERALHRRAGSPTLPGRWAHVAMQARHHLLLVIPALLLITAQQSLVFALPGPAAEQFLAGLTLLLVLVVLLLIPWILRVVLGLQPLPPGPLRSRLEAVARRLNCRCSDILLWRTHDSLANAMVTGVSPWLRYVILTDRLAEHLTGPELEAVFGHEVSHVKHRHMLYYMGFVVVSLALGWCLWLGLREWAMPLVESGVQEWLPGVYQALTAYGVFEETLLLALLCVEIVVLFGFISRRCERQADVDGCRAVSCTRRYCLGHEDGEALPPNGRGLCATGIRTFISALEKVALLNGISRDRPGWLSSWQHSTIAKRVRFLEKLIADPREESHLHFSVRLIQLGILLGLVVVVLWAAPYM